jgi:hypothetical protein
MTRSKPGDWENTASVILAYLNGEPLESAVLNGQPLDSERNWLGHSMERGTAAIDKLLIEGISLEELCAAVSDDRTLDAVKDHLAHLWKPVDTPGNGAHALPFQNRPERSDLKGFWIFDREALGLPQLDASLGIAATQEASDLATPPERIPVEINRILRDTELAREIKKAHGYKCQMCEYVLRLPDGSDYAEAHHIQPLGQPHNGPDVAGNILCLCARHHAEVDYGAIRIDIRALRTHSSHKVDERYVAYHNKIYGWS